MTAARPSSSPATRARERLAGLPGRAAGRLRQAWVRIAMDGVVAVVAFVLAQVVLRQPAPIFAPIAAIVCLTDSAEKRGQRAVRLLLGVIAGVLVGEGAKLVVGSGWLQVGAAVVVGMLVVATGQHQPAGPAAVRDRRPPRGGDRVVAGRLDSAWRAR